MDGPLTLFTLLVVLPLMTLGGVLFEVISTSMHSRYLRTTSLGNSTDCT